MRIRGEQAWAALGWALLFVLRVIGTQVLEFFIGYSMNNLFMGRPSSRQLRMVTRLPFAPAS